MERADSTIAQPTAGAGDTASAEAPANAPSSPDEQEADPVVLGTGQFVQAARGPERAVYAGEDGVTLNFEKAQLHEFLSVVFDKILMQNYVVDSVGERYGDAAHNATHYAGSGIADCRDRAAAQ